MVCAMPMELAAVATAARLQRMESSGRRAPKTGLGSLHRGSIAGAEVIAVATGMGPPLARAGIEDLLDEHAVRAVVVAGIAGSTDTTRAIGTVVDPSVVIDAASGDRFEPHRSVTSSPSGALWTTNVITAPEDLPPLLAQGVVALDMETASIASICQARDIPWAVARAISDDPSDEVIDEVFAMANQDGTANPKRVASYVIRHPHHVARMARLGRNASLAARNAAAAAVDVCRAFASV